MTYLISTDRLKRRMNNNTVIVDTRFELADPDAGRQAYLENHIPDAVYLDLNHDLSGKPLKHGGTHPLPDLDQFAQKLGNIGIDHDTTVVIYDQDNHMFAPRLWWMLHTLGHRKAYVLDGGYARWVAEGNEVTLAVPSLTKKQFVPQVDETAFVDMKQLKEKLKEDDALLIDSRSKERYLGQTEPMYRKAGHIPGAVHYFWQDVLTEKGRWKSNPDLAQHFAALPKEKEIIVSCGSGVSATPNILALKMIGYQNVTLYPGSFSDWISYEENEVRTGEEHHG
ncbi:sulfurtransferase [Virgibacillus sp. LDC-1]|uniref:sulfurtransferase n=1 Tax=Virgibacillus sp. LDC-1 TaxID=3039856 RepID=UPI0024DEBF98|nr:sulfurtransferase [Virgibacillus sp. LDC-1]